VKGRKESAGGSEKSNPRCRRKVQAEGGAERTVNGENGRLKLNGIGPEQNQQNEKTTRNLFSRNQTNAVNTEMKFRNTCIRNERTTE